MSGSGLQVWSQTAATNATADSAINWAEGQSPSSVNDSARAQMAATAKWRDDNNGTVITTGSSAAFTGTSNQTSTGLVNGYTIALQFHATADASATYNHDTLGAKQLQLKKDTNLAGGEFESGSIHRFTYITTSTAWVKNGHEALSSGAVTTASIADLAVTAAKIADATITSGKLVDSTIATTKIAGAAVTGAKIADTTIATTNIADSAIATAKIAAGAVTSAKIAYGLRAAAFFTVSGGTVTLVNASNATVTRNGTGDYTLNIASATTDANYVAFGMAEHTDSGSSLTVQRATGGTKTTSAYRFVCTTAGAGIVDPVSCSIAIFGN